MKKILYIGGVLFVLAIMLTTNLDLFAQGSPPPPPPPPPGGTGPPCWPPPCIPIDNGIELLVLGGAAIAAVFLGKKTLKP